MANTEAEHINLYIHPDEVRPPFQTAADLLNGVLPFAEKLTVWEIGGRTGVVLNLNANITHFFPDGIVSIIGYDEKGYKRFVDGREQSYLAHLRAVLAGVTVGIDYRTSVSYSNRNPTQ